MGEDGLISGDESGLCLGEIGNPPLEINEEASTCLLIRIIIIPGGNDICDI